MVPNNIIKYLECYCVVIYFDSSFTKLIENYLSITFNAFSNNNYISKKAVRMTLDGNDLLFYPKCAL